MIKHGSSTRWPDDREVGWHYVWSAPCTRRRGAQFYWFSFKTNVDVFSWFGLKTGSYGSCGLASKSLARFPSLSLKTGSCGFVIWPIKSPRQFLSLGLKTKWAMIYQLRHKIDRRMKTAWDTRRDLAACFTWKRVRLGFSSLASRLVEARRGWCTWHHHGGRVKIKLKTDRSRRRAASDSSTPTLPFLLYYVIRAV
jgi:hypothetical protein